VDGGLQAQRARVEALAAKARARSAIDASDQQLAVARALIEQSNRLILRQPMDTRASTGGASSPAPDT
jgi:hypothetical protein